MNKILVIGSTNIDMIACVKHLPRPGETVGEARFMQSNGGKGANQAVAAARLGGDVAFVSCLGDDAGAAALRQQFAARGLRLVILKGCRRTGSYLLYLYRERDLAEVLGRREHRDFLRAMGYTPWEAPGDCLRQLAARLCLEEEFPHEIGVFLGYPLDDVKGFIRHKGRDYTFCGCWKCYGDPQAARRRFERYRRCTAVLRRRYAEGTPITQLIVAA